MTDIRMPALSDQMEQGTIIKWLVADGEPVAAGEELVEIETDKATVAYEAEADGVLEIVVAEGETAAVGDVIARLGDGGPRETRRAEGPVREPATAVSNGDGPSPTPVARRVAAEHDVDLAAIDGTGPRGRITKGDVLAAAGVQAPPPRPKSTGTAPNRLQQIVGQRMTAAAAIPAFQVATDAAMDAAVALRAELKSAAGDRAAPSVNDLIVKACALALRDHPLVNGSYADGTFELHDDINVGVAVATDEGLLVATVRNADALSLGQIAAESRRLAEAARSGKATPADLSGATFTVSNLGMFGMTQITAVLNPPQAAILGVGAVRDTGLLTLNLTCDHRILNGADGSRFLADVRALLERPFSLVL
jgi:pyruvate dehydrogenase E2 component (dihydrolipoamide acetyltransferase)